MDRLHFACAHSRADSPSTGLEQALDRLEQALGGVSPDLVLAFATPHHAPTLEGPRGVRASLARRLGARAVAGCTAAKLVADELEIESGPALVLWSARMPDTRVRLYHVQATPAPGAAAGAGSERRWEFLGLPRDDEARPAHALLLADPFTFPVVEFLGAARSLLPGSLIFGGIASGGDAPGRNRLVLTDRCVRAGAVLVTFAPEPDGADRAEVPIRPFVSQGCRPVGEPLVITACQGNRITRLRGRGAAGVLIETIEALPAGERDLFRRGAFVGLAVDPTKSRFEAADLLVRQIAGLEPRENAIAVIDDSLRPGMSVQFLVRDAESASEELARLLGRLGGGEDAGSSQRGALLFTCTGRGERMFGRAHHDAGRVQEAFGGSIPLAGFFAGGEIGPVGPCSYLHGFSATVALFG